MNLQLYEKLKDSLPWFRRIKVKAAVSRCKSPIKVTTIVEHCSSYGWISSSSVAWPASISRPIVPIPLPGNYRKLLQRRSNHPAILFVGPHWYPRAGRKILAFKILRFQAHREIRRRVLFAMSERSRMELLMATSVITISKGAQCPRQRAATSITPSPLCYIWWFDLYASETITKCLVNRR